MRHDRSLGHRMWILLVITLALGVQLPAHAKAGKWSIPVLELSYFPTKDGVTLDAAEVGIDLPVGTTIEAAKERVATLSGLLIDALARGSAYHGYKDATAAPSLQYRILGRRTFLKPVPKSTEFHPYADHLGMLQNLDICDYVDRRGVKEVWIWMYHSDKVVPIESNMAGPYGDISNSNRQPDLPVCAKTYTVYDYNYGRWLGEALEDHGHQIEAVFSYVGGDLWRNYVGPTGAQAGDRRCGSVHTPPNGASDYDWANAKDAVSDCEDWKPDDSGAKQVVNCHTWYGARCADDGGIEYKVWWMQNIPGEDNALTDKERLLRNWWEFFGDFDTAMAKGRQLVRPTDDSHD